MTADKIFAFSQSKAGLSAAWAYLSGATYLDNLIAVRLSRLDVLRSRATRVTRMLDGMPGSGQYSALFGETAAGLADLEAELLK